MLRNQIDQQIQSNPNPNPNRHFYRNRRTDSVIYMEKQRPRTARTNLTKNKGGQLTVHDVETHYKAGVIATASYRHRDKCIRQ